MTRRKTALFIMSLFFSISLLPVNTASSLDFVMSEEKKENIKTNCTSIKESIKKVQNSDRNTRVSLGRTYQQILNDFIMPLNVRLVKNNQFNSNLNDIQNNFAQKREEFNKDYISYGQELETLLSTDCKENPVEFYSNLMKTRTAREKVAKSTKRLQEILDEHITEVKSLQESLRKPVEEVVNE